MGERENWVHIGRAAELLGISTTAVRNRADRGLLKCSQDPDTGWRLFHVNDLYERRRIMDMERQAWGNEPTEPLLNGGRKQIVCEFNGEWTACIGVMDRPMGELQQTLTGRGEGNLPLPLMWRGDIRGAVTKVWVSKANRTIHAAGELWITRQEFISDLRAGVYPRMDATVGEDSWRLVAVTLLRKRPESALDEVVFTPGVRGEFGYEEPELPI